MSFFDDLKSFKSLSEEHFSNFIEYCNSREYGSAKNYVLFEKFKRDTGLSAEDVGALNRIIGFIADFIINEKTIQSGIIEFEKEFDPFFKNDNDANIAWTSIKEKINDNKLESFILYRKEQRLKSQVPHLHQFSLVCDARPIFDVDRKKVIKYLFPIILKIKNHDEEIKLYELDEDDLLRLKKEVDTAISKLVILKDTTNAES